MSSAEDSEEEDNRYPKEIRCADFMSKGDTNPDIKCY